MRECNRCRKETDKVFCPFCHSLTFPKVVGTPSVAPSEGESFECTIWQGPNRTRGIEVPQTARERHFPKKSDLVVLHIDGKRTVARLGSSFWKKPAVIKNSVGDNGKDQLIKFFEKHHLLPPQQSLKEKGIVDTLVFEVMVPREEFKVVVAEKQERQRTDETEED